jgi:hypothetical protein
MRSVPGEAEEVFWTDWSVLVEREKKSTCPVAPMYLAAAISATSDIPATLNSFGLFNCLSASLSAPNLAT